MRPIGILKRGVGQLRETWPRLLQRNGGGFGFGVRVKVKVRVRVRVKLKV